MKHSAIFWLLLLLPTLVLGGATLWLVHREAERMEDNLQAMRQAQRTSLDEHAAHVAGNVLVGFEEVREGLLETLAEAPTADLDQVMRDMPQENAFVSAAGLWQAGEGFVAGTLEASRGPAPWQERGLTHQDAERQHDARVTRQEAYAHRQMQTRRDLGRRARGQSDDAELQERMLADLDVDSEPELTLDQRQARERREEPVLEADGTGTADGSLAHGWDWVETGQERVLWGWVYDADAGQVRVLEMDLRTLEEELASLLPEQAEQEQPAWDLIVAQSEASEADAHERMLVGHATLGRALPGWAVQYRAPLHEAPVQAAAFRWLGRLMVAGIVLSIGIGGVLLRWELTAAEREARTKTHFLANVTHELKTPLTAIQLYAEMLSRGKDAEMGTRQRYLQTIRDETGRLERLVANILEQSRLERDPQFKLHVRAIDLSEHLQQFVQRWSPEVEAAGMKLGLQLAEPTPRIQADPDALNQVLANLVDNAMKYAREGGSIEIQAVADEQRRVCEVAVMDRGPGVPSHLRGRLFERFTRGDTELTSAEGGLGLGLSIAHALVHRMDGNLHYTPRSGGGSVLTVALKVDRS